MGCGASTKKRKNYKNIKLSQELFDKIDTLFKKIDLDLSRSITKDEANQFFNTKFGKQSVDAMFNEVDVDNSDSITDEEFLDFWRQVKGNGYKEEDIMMEIDELLKGGTWVDWNDDRGVGSK
mmetsp:Transcript_63760/g.152013  ORF Transcript_63760/g.152013 Transcript_63760/m.152013 type:complete len:122 (+) Transcript_63760:117-482(+)|eukprot:CAMPEP_0178408444 /NCGR_PEP_ID=MMETSP0689_2-20121128/19945_1 /TAXON_ID=160604 /ORGANISM="Amphidinium massartii, Strain CS-259" /LENGTH=121 /DNA_ID=CAMNT_0020029545 /DNA_START=52 /DNA_END=417 /DNA_ORIENTATION=+